MYFQKVYHDGTRSGHLYSYEYKVYIVLLEQAFGNNTQNYCNNNNGMAKKLIDYCNNP